MPWGFWSGAAARWNLGAGVGGDRPLLQPGLLSGRGDDLVSPESEGLGSKENPRFRYYSEPPPIIPSPRLANSKVSW